MLCCAICVFYDFLRVSFPPGCQSVLKGAIVCSVLYEAESYAERLDFLISALVIKEQLMVCISTSTLVSEWHRRKLTISEYGRPVFSCSFLKCASFEPRIRVSGRRVSFRRRMYLGRFQAGQKTVWQASVGNSCRPPEVVREVARELGGHCFI